MNDDRAQPPPKSGTPGGGDDPLAELYWGNIGPAPGQGGGRCQYAPLLCYKKPAGTPPQSNTTATISVTTGQKEEYCHHQANMAALEAILPYGHVLVGGDYKPSAVVGDTAEVAIDQTLDWASSSTALLSGIRSVTQIPKSITAKFFRIAGWVSTGYVAYDAITAAQKEYKACME